jgi:DNA modification methylase
MLRTEIDGNIVQQADSRRASSYAAVLGEDRVPLLHADPPYCLLVRRGKKGQKRDPKKAKINHSAVTRYEDVAAYRRFTRAWLLPAADRVAEGGHAVIWTNLLGRQPITDVAEEAGLVPHGHFLWAKLGKKGNVGEQVARLYEVALVFGRGPAPELEPGDLAPPRHHISGYDDDGEAGDWEHHPNHKPMSLLAPILRYYTRPGERVLEPFSGSGSTAAAAVKLGRKVSALELRETWARVSGERLRGAGGAPAGR